MTGKPPILFERMQIHMMTIGEQRDVGKDKCQCALRYRLRRTHQVESHTREQGQQSGRQYSPRRAPERETHDEDQSECKIA